MVDTQKARERAQALKEHAWVCSDAQAYFSDSAAVADVADDVLALAAALDEKERELAEQARIYEFDVNVPIAELREENERLRIIAGEHEAIPSESEAVAIWKRSYYETLDRAEAAEARADRLEQALRRLSHVTADYHGNPIATSECDVCKAINDARAALSGLPAEEPAR